MGSPGAGKKRFATALRAILAILLVLGIWEAFAMRSDSNRHILPPPTAVAGAIWTGIFGGGLLDDTWASIKRVLIGFSVAAVLGICFGVIGGMYKPFRDFTKPLIDFLRPIPPIAWIPIALLWFGYGDPPAYFLVGLGAFFPIYSNTAFGMMGIEPGSLDVAASHGASRQLTFWRVIVPQLLPPVFVGLKTGLGVAWMVVITAELVGAQSGLGYSIQVSRSQLQADQVLAGMVMIGIVGYALQVVISVMVIVVMPWRRRNGVSELTRGAQS